MTDNETAQWKITLFGAVMGLLPVAVALVPHSALYWYFEVRTGGGWLSFDVWDNLRWAVVFIVIYIVVWQALELAAAYALSNHRERVEGLADWLDRWYW